MKKIISIVLVALTMMTLLSISVSAASTKTKIMATTGYRGLDKTTVYGQSYVEKALTVKKGKTVAVSAYLTAATKINSPEMTKYVRFAVWVYDVKTGKRVATNVVSVGETYKLPVDKSAAHTYSVQIRPYIHSSAWQKYSTVYINAYVKSAQYGLTY